MALHEQCVGATDEWYTPPEIFGALDAMFTTDVASPGGHVTPWIPADDFITERSLEAPWRGFVWMNPPFGGRNALRPWLQKFVEHANGVCLVPDRTSAPWWQEYAPQMDAILFVRKKIKFIGANGKRGVAPAQGTCLMAIGHGGLSALKHAAPQLGLLLMVSSTAVASELGEDEQRQPDKR